MYLREKVMLFLLDFHWDLWDWVWVSLRLYVVNIWSLLICYFILGYIFVFLITSNSTEGRGEDALGFIDTFVERLFQYVGGKEPQNVHALQDCFVADFLFSSLFYHRGFYGFQILLLFSQFYLIDEL